MRSSKSQVDGRDTFIRRQPALNAVMKRLRKVMKRKRRKYPIRRDESGRSARQRCFLGFRKVMTLAQAARDAGVTSRTARRYYADFKKSPEEAIHNPRLVSAR